MAVNVQDLIDRATSGDRGALARALSMIERGGVDARSVVAALHARPASSWTIGVTGAPGAGKSTLTDRLVAALVDDDESVAVLAIDPTSPFSGGAILGDRIRMQSHDTDPRVFIRSMATRGHLGGLSAAAPQAGRLFAAAGFAWVVLETVGVGQVEVEVAGHADTTVVVVNPGWGDAVQANKAGLMEIADVFVVNKSDRPGAADTVRELQSMLALTIERAWSPPIVQTVAATGEGVSALADAVRAHRAFALSSDLAATRVSARARDELRTIVTQLVTADALARCEGPTFDALVESVVAGERDPYGAATALLDGGA